jgi:5-methylcytosine-specific restriction protein A
MPHRAKQQPTARAPRESAAKRGYGRRWRNARAAFLATHSLCVACEDLGKVTPATVVDHRIPVEGPEDGLFWKSGNWQPLCKVCHDEKTARESGWQPRKKQ